MDAPTSRRTFANGATHIVHILGFVAGVPLDELDAPVSVEDAAPDWPAQSVALIQRY